MSARHLSLRIVSLLVLGPIALLFPACSSGPSSSSPTRVPVAAAAPPTAVPELGKVTMGYTPNMSMAPLYVALEKGYYRDQGLDVSLQTLPGGSDMVTQTASGNFDVGVGGTGAGLFNAFARGIRLTLVTTVAVFKPVGCINPRCSAVASNSQRLVLVNESAQPIATEDLRDTTG